jgi:uridine kinase
MKKMILILRGCSGSGKTLFANNLDIPNKKVVCADDYFCDEDGNYNFDVAKIGYVHIQCMKKFSEYLESQDVTTIVVANTNTKESDWKFYEEEGKKAGADIIFLVIENRHGNVNQHNVPEETLHRQEQNIRNSLKLR